MACGIFGKMCHFLDEPCSEPQICSEARIQGYDCTEPRRDCCDLICNITFGLLVFIAQLLSCLVCLAILCYCLETEFTDAHIFLCTFGFPFLAVQAILNMNATKNYCENLERAQQRLYAHAILQLIAIVFILLGLIVVSMKHGFSTGKTHGVLGLTATILAMIALVTGIVSVCVRRPCSLIHVCLGLITLIISSVCLIYGLKTPKFRDRFGKKIMWICMAAVYIYTVIIIILTMIKIFLCCAFPLKERCYHQEYVDTCRRSPCNSNQRGCSRGVVLTRSGSGRPCYTYKIC